MRTASRHLQLIALVVVCVAIAWGGVLFGSFQYDDYPNILTDPATAGGRALWERVATGIRPLTRVSYAVDHALWGRWAGGWLLVNLALHVLSVIGLAWLALARGLSMQAAVLATTIFAMQPAHGVVVAYVSGRSSGLMTALLIATLIAHEQRRELLALLLLVLACAAKEVALVFPFLLWLWQRTRAAGLVPDAQSRPCLAPYFLVSIGLFAVAALSPRYRLLFEYSLAIRSPLESLAQNAAALPATLSLWARPWALTVEHEAPSSIAANLAGTLFLFGVVTLGIATLQRRPLIALGVLWPVIALLPTHSLIAKADAVSESPLYLAWIGPSIALGAGVAQWMKAASMRVWAVAIVLTVMASLCVWRVHVWGDPIALWREAVASVPQSSRAWNNLGQAYLAKGHNDAANHAFEEALTRDPRNMKARMNMDMMNITQ